MGPTRDERGGEVLIERSARAADLEWPTMEVATGADGESINRAYVHLRQVSWADVKRIAAIETKAIEERTSSSRECLDDERSDELYDSLFGLDLGVAAAVFALAAAKCVPLYSCNGERGHNDSYPVVVFRCRKERLPDLMAIAERIGCGLVNGRSGTAVLYSGRLERMMEFGRELLESRARLSRLRPRRQMKPTRHPDAPQLSLF